jgi:hypothetical protein
MQNYSLKLETTTNDTNYTNNFYQESTKAEKFSAKTFEYVFCS